MKKLIYIYLLIMFPLSIKADSLWTLIQYVIENNLSIYQKSLKVKQSIVDVKNSLSLEFEQPSIHSKSFGYEKQFYTTFFQVERSCAWLNGYRRLSKGLQERSSFT